MKIEQQFATPVLLTIFNRPDTTERVFDEIRKARPLKLYVAADGPRDIAGDREKCKAARAVVARADWPCEVMRLYSERNLGCGLGVSMALNWFFESESEGIVLEDDTVPNQDFFRFCQELLERYRNDERVMLIGGNNFQNGFKRGDGSYYFGKYPMMWGWAGWRRAWKLYDFKMAEFPTFKKENQIKNIFDDPSVQEYWTKIFELTYEGNIDTWDYQWLFSIWMQNGLCITPNVNLVSNIGCGHKDSTHTHDPDDHLASVQTFPIGTLIHPTFVIRNKDAEESDSQNVFAIGEQSETAAAECGFVGDFSSWEEAKKQCAGYDSGIILEKVKSAALKVRSGEAVYERDSVLFDKTQYSWPLLSGLLWIASVSDNKLNLLDFGGALGTSYYQNRKFLKHLKELNWNIVEQEHFVRCGTELFEDDHLKFHLRIEDCLQGKDIPNAFLLSGCLQYIEKPYELLKKIADLKFQYLLIDRTPFSADSTECIKVQKASPDVYDGSYPHWFFDRSKFRNYVSGNYEVIEEFESLIDWSNYPASYKGFILKRIENSSEMHSRTPNIEKSLEAGRKGQNGNGFYIGKTEEKPHHEATATVVSVVICTYNRAHLLKIALESLEKQTINKAVYEIIVVNNNCTDATVKVVHEFMERFANCRMIHEANQGLSHARNRGYKEAKGKYIAYLDDDAKAPINWVEEMTDFIERRPDVDVFGGPYYEYSFDPIPEWLPSSIRSHTLGNVEHALGPDEWIHGCNMVLSKSILEKYGGFNINFGMKGKTIGYGEETELLLRIRNDKADLYYVPSLHVKHVIDTEKCSLTWHLRSYYADGKYSTAVFNKKVEVLPLMYSVLKLILISPLIFFKEQNIPTKRRLYYSLRQIFYSLGVFSGILLKKKLSDSTAKCKA